MEMQNAEEIHSEAGSEFVRAELADFNNEQEQQHQQSNIGHQNVLDWTIGQSTIDDGKRKLQNELLEAKIMTLEKNCALLEEKLENAKLRGKMEKEDHEKAIGQIQRDFVVNQQKVEKLEKVVEEQTRQMEEMKADLLEKCQQKMDEKLEAANKQFEQLILANQKKLEAAVNERIGKLEKANQQKHNETDKCAEKVEIVHNKWQLCNSKMNKWDETGTRAKVSKDGLSANSTGGYPWRNVFAVFPFSFPAIQQENENHGMQINYFEIKTDDIYHLHIGLSAYKHKDGAVGGPDNSFGIEPCCVDTYSFSGFPKEFEWPSGAIQPKINEKGCNVIGCGVLNWRNQKRAIFFTANGTLLGSHIPITTYAPLYPAVSLFLYAKVEANFGDNPADPFWYNIANCHGFDMDKE